VRERNPPAMCCLDDVTYRRLAPWPFAGASRHRSVERRRGCSPSRSYAASRITDLRPSWPRTGAPSHRAQAYARGHRQNCCLGLPGNLGLSIGGLEPEARHLGFRARAC